jgi:hypothetical protein
VNDPLENPKSIIAHGLAEFFKDEPHKAVLWVLCKNPHFGGTSPAELIVILGKGGLQRVAGFILTASEESKGLE